MPKKQSIIVENTLLSDFIIMDLSDAVIKKKIGSLQGKWNSIIYITGGSSILQIDFEEFIASENRVFFIEKYKVWN